MKLLRDCCDAVGVLAVGTNNILLRKKDRKTAKIQNEDLRKIRVGMVGLDYVLRFVGALGSSWEGRGRDTKVMLRGVQPPLPHRQSVR